LDEKFTTDLVLTTCDHLDLNMVHFYRAMLHRARYCRSKSSVRPSLCDVQVLWIVIT